MTITRATLEARDRDDPLASFRALFALPQGVIYLDGNSLGPLPRATPARVAEVVAREWGDGLIRSWNSAGWIDLPARVGDKIGRLLGAPAGSVIVADSTSINLFKLLGVALALRPQRRVILSEQGNFPTDLYIAEGLAALLRRDHVLRVVPRGEIASAIDGEVAVVMLTHVGYRDGAMHDMRALTDAAHRAGALALWDLAHSAGAVPVALEACGADLAVGCGYKFLNGGPGAPAFLYVAPRHQEAMRMPLTGWFGHAAPFAFESGFRRAAGIVAALVGTPPILSLAALEVGVDIALQAPMAAVREKSRAMGTLFAALVAQECEGTGLRLVSPDDPLVRGSQICFAHAQGYAVMQALIERGIIGDFRAPDILRFGITPLTLRYVEVWDAVAALRAVLAGERWREDRFQVRKGVT
jgi:kynureninase